ncbi:hypothetical protein FVEG_05157 [Fusarium verticillioides 7600]|uniref:Uncharacterized protein n=1 Tax=Gibberella moniliformis (strain M3125 / FGSC 7600) TaxID=334819 RepID=W7M8L7_GIBM7|nr:hypothetical protein FVEG_05157 [Fusarium verticillioides 7600]EWG43875.1 hypothetical protein FVEG_05157 [Fusarium verticillioides 7600]
MGSMKYSMGLSRKETTRDENSIPSSEQHIVTTCYISKTTHERPRVSIRLNGRLHESQGTPLMASKRSSGSWH